MTFALEGIEVALDFFSEERAKKYGPHLEVCVLSESNGCDKEIISSAHSIADIDGAIFKVQLDGIELDGDGVILSATWDCLHEDDSEYLDSMCLVRQSAYSCTKDWSMVPGARFSVLDDGKVKVETKTNVFSWWAKACCKVNLARHLIEDSNGNKMVNFILFAGSQFPLPRVENQKSSETMYEPLLQGFTYSDHHFFSKLIKNGQLFSIGLSKLGSNEFLISASGTWHHYGDYQLAKGRRCFRAMKLTLPLDKQLFASEAPQLQVQILTNDAGPENFDTISFKDFARVEDPDCIKYFATASEHKLQCRYSSRWFVSHNFKHCSLCGKQYCSKHESTVCFLYVNHCVCLVCRDKLKRNYELASGSSTILPIYAMLDETIKLRDESSVLEKIFRHKAETSPSYSLTYPLMKPTTQDLKERLLTNPIIIHMAGHSSRPLCLEDSSGSVGLVWWGDSGNPQVINNDEFGSLFAVASGSSSHIECIFLNACSTYELGMLLREYGVPYIVCWKTKADDECCMKLAEHFYKCLQANPGCYGQAFQNACARTSLQLELTGKVLAQPDKGGVGIPFLLWNDPTSIDSVWVELYGKCSESGFEEASKLPVRFNFRGWDEPKGSNDFSAKAGLNERKVLELLGFNVQALYDVHTGKISAHFMEKGKLSEEALAYLGVSKYRDLWGKDGEVTKQAKAGYSSGRLTEQELVQAINELTSAVENRQRGLEEYSQAITLCSGTVSRKEMKQYCFMRRSHDFQMRIVYQTMDSLMDLLKLPSRAMQL